jgi:hypothetical protein
MEKSITGFTNVGYVSYHILEKSKDNKQARKHLAMIYH